MKMKKMAEILYLNNIILQYYYENFKYFSMIFLIKLIHLENCYLSDKLFN